MTLRNFIYPQGSALSWHDDDNDRVGAYSFCCHKSWNARWGGELLLAESKREPTNSIGDTAIDHLSNSEESALLMEDGFGTFILPKPNRLVVFKSGIMYMIKRIDSNAGEALRMVNTGFFLKKI
ncbi:MAG: hypothetical protein ACO3LE_11400 [Bdellovibrionota bacterium]